MRGAAGAILLGLVLLALRLWGQATIDTAPPAAGAQAVGKGPTFRPSRAAVIDANGFLGVPADATLSDCVHVDGTAAACGGGSSPNFADDETPAVVSTLIYTLAHTPATGSLQVFLNGQRMQRGVDYTLSGATVTFVSYWTATLTGSLPVAVYRY